MAWTLEKVVEYIPESERGNETDPVKFHIKKATVSEFRLFATKKQKLAKGMDGSLSNDQIKDQEETIKKYIVKIENLSVDGDPVETGEQLCKVPGIDQKQMVEIETAIIEINSGYAGEDEEAQKITCPECGHEFTDSDDEDEVKNSDTSQ